MKVLTDRNGTEIKVGHELDVPLDVFSTGIVTVNENDELSLELRFEGKKVPIKHIKHLEVLDSEKIYL